MCILCKIVVFCLILYLYGCLWRCYLQLRSDIFEWNLSDYLFLSFQRHSTIKKVDADMGPE
jgi:hypothetical protein